jgi:sugar phosphate isomerase/epimerase
MITLALSSWSFHQLLRRFNVDSWSPHGSGKEISLLEFPSISTSFGISALEVCQAHLASTDTSYLERVCQALQDAGCRVINVPIDVGNLAESSPERRAEEIEMIMQWIDAARALGSPAVRVNTGTPTGEDEARVLEIVADGYRRLASFCGDRGMTVLLENHGGLSASPGVILDLLQMVDAPNFQLCPDFGNFPSEIRAEGLRAMLPHAAVVHAKVYDLDEGGAHRTFDLDACLQLVTESGYVGPLSIEFEGQGDPYGGVRRAKDHLTRFFSSPV